MAQKTKRNKRVPESTRFIMNINSFDEIGIVTLDGFHLAFLGIQPFNIAVLGTQGILGYIKKFRTVLEDTGNPEILCISSAQSYERNKSYLKGRVKDENVHPEIRKICQLDIEYLDNISLTMSTSRAFYLVYRFKNIDINAVNQAISENLSIVKDNGFYVHKSKKDELMRAFAIYWEQNTFLDDYPEFDGQQFLKEEEI